MASSLAGKVNMARFGAGEPLVLVRAFFQDVGLNRPHVAGYSLGGAIALELAAAGEARSVTAISPAGFCTRTERWWALAVLRGMRAATFLPAGVLRRTLAVRGLRIAGYAPLVAHPERIDPVHAVDDALAFRQGRGFNPVARAGRHYQFHGSPAVPVMVAWGDKDRILVPRQAVRAEQQLPQARHVRLPDCGHVPMTDNPDLVAELIIQTAGSEAGPG